MKKTAWVLLAAVVVLGGGILLYYSHKAVPSSGPSSSAPSSSALGSSSSAASSSAAPLSSSASSPVQKLTDAQITAKIQSEIPLDWKKYTLKERKENPVKAGGTTYRTFDVWDADYQEGPAILYSPDDGKLYTYTSSDKAPVLAADDPAFDKTERTVTGVIQDGAMMSITIKTPEGNVLTIRRLGVKLVNLDKGFIIGNNVKVTYTGTYSGNDSQRMFVQKIEGIA